MQNVKRHIEEKRGLFWSSLIFAVVVGLVGQLDFMGVKSAASHRSESLFLRLVGGPWYTPHGRKQVTVVLIDDDYLKELDTHWPLEYVEQAGLVEEIAEYYPQSLFIDFLYQHMHGEQVEFDQLVSSVREARVQKGARVYIPHLVSVEPGLDACVDSPDNALDLVERTPLAERLMAEGAARSVYVRWSGCINRYPSFLLGDERLRTPAWAIYSDAVRPTLAPVKGADWAADFFKPMMVRWGTKVSPEQIELLANTNIQCGDSDWESPSRLGYVYAQVRHILGRQLFSDEPFRGKYAPCPYIDTVHASWLLRNDEPTRAHLTKLIEGRNVLLGAQITGIHDSIANPVNGHVPGVYLIAAAAENYFNYNDNYYRDDSKIISIVYEIFALFLITYLTGRGWEKYQAYRQTRFNSQSATSLNDDTVTENTRQLKISIPDSNVSLIDACVATFLFKLILPLTIAFFVAIVLWKFGSAPFNWLAIAILSFIANPVRMSDCAGVEAGGILAWLANKVDAKFRWSLYEDLSQLFSAVRAAVIDRRVRRR